MPAEEIPVEEFNYFTSNKEIFFHTAKHKAKEVKFDMIVGSNMASYFSSEGGYLSPVEEMILYHIKRLEGFIKWEKYDHLPIRYDYDLAHNV